MTSRTTFAVVYCASVIAGVSCGSASTPAPADDAAQLHSAELQLLRDATRSYAALDSAVAAGYARDVRDCLVHEHHGAMGYHHVNPSFMDSELDLTKPEILLYERLRNGEYRLNGVEFIVPYQFHPSDSTAPRILGQRLRREDNLQVWYLHVWAWTENPDGMFENFHPAIRCADSARKVFRPSGT